MAHITEEEYLNKVAPDTQITVDEYKNAITGAHKLRTIVTYYIWKQLKQLHPEIDADEVLVKAYREFGQKSGEKWGEIETASEGLFKQSSRAGFTVFEQELVEISDEYAQKNFHYCPHVDALKSIGASAEEIRFFCQDVLSSGDYGNIDVHPGFELEFKKQIGAGDDHCEYCLRKCNKGN